MYNIIKLKVSSTREELSKYWLSQSKTKCLEGTYQILLLLDEHVRNVLWLPGITQALVACHQTLPFAVQSLLLSFHVCSFLQYVSPTS